MLYPQQGEFEFANLTPMRVKGYGHRPSQEERDRIIVEMRREGTSLKNIIPVARCGWKTVRKVLACELGETFGPKPVKRSKKQNGSIHAFEDPIGEVGYELQSIPDGGCHFPVARWPADYPRQRFCGAPCTVKMRDGRVVFSPWCTEHHVVCHGVAQK